MKTGLRNDSAVKVRMPAERALTLVETMVTMSIFSMVVLALVYTHIFGLRQDQLVESKLGASDQSRKSIGMIARDIRCAKITAIGNYAGGAFTPIANGTPQQGNAVQINLTAAATVNIIYYFDTTTADNWKLCRFRTGDATPSVIASNLQNSCTFAAENQRGDTQTDVLNRRVIHYTLDFRQYQYPQTTVGPSCLYDRYTMDMRVTPHVPEGL
jgi:Tfp pilus assembly protein PilW